jgi:hypothetical protein
MVILSLERQEHNHRGYDVLRKKISRAITILNFATSTLRFSKQTATPYTDLTGQGRHNVFSMR